MKASKSQLKFHKFWSKVSWKQSHCLCFCLPSSLPPDTHARQMCWCQRWSQTIFFLFSFFLLMSECELIVKFLQWGQDSVGFNFFNRSQTLKRGEMADWILEQELRSWDGGSILVLAGGRKRACGGACIFVVGDVACMHTQLTPTHWASAGLWVCVWLGPPFSWGTEEPPHQLATPANQGPAWWGPGGCAQAEHLEVLTLRCWHVGQRDCKCLSARGFLDSAMNRL